MEIGDIIQSKENVVKYIKENGYKQEDFSDSEYKKGVYFRIDNRKLLVVYEIDNEEEIREIKNHFLIDMGLSYCVLFVNNKIMFFRNFGETKYFIYSERTKDYVSKIDKLKNIKESFDILFQTKDISAYFYNLFKDKRNILASKIKNKISITEKYLLAQKIFDRFFFIYFLGHKGIIKLKNGQVVSGNLLFSKILLNNGDFIDNMKKLFALFNSQKDNVLKIGEFEINVPYLNGGLFRPDILERNLDIDMNNKDWAGIFEFLNDYHWIIEDIKTTEVDEEKILTPEILGHVYERSVVEWESEGFGKEKDEEEEVSERKKKGVYYTPEEITEYITTNTINPYLMDIFDGKYEDFEEFIKKANKNELRIALDKLSTIRVLDPACGSGAFLIKACEIIFYLKRRILYKLGEKIKYYDVKLNTITENIYGVDILSGAIEISKLRLWLWLISDYVDETDIKALPNIEYNLRVGNSLIGWVNESLPQISLSTPLTEEVKGIFRGLRVLMKGEDRENLDSAKGFLEKYNLNDYIEAYYLLYKIYRKSHGEEAEDLRDILETIRKSIYKSINPPYRDYLNKKIKPNYNPNKPIISEKDYDSFSVFHWRIDFGHIIKNGGFDVVIGNPPYFPITDCSKTEKSLLFALHPEFSEGEYSGKIDIYSFFIINSIKNLLKSNHYFSFIIPKTILSNISFTILRKTLIEEYIITQLVDLEKVFDEVTGTMTYLLLFLKNKKPNKPYELELNSMNRGGNINKSKISIEMLKRPPFYIWVTNKIKLELLNRIEKDTIPLKEFYITKNGVCTGDNSKYVSDNKIDSEYKKIHVAKDISQYKLKPISKYVRYNRDLLHRPREEGIFKSPKILSQMIRGLNTSYRLICSLDETNDLCLNNINIIRKRADSSNLILLLGYLNSKIINFYFKNSITDVNIKTIYLDIIPLKFSLDKNKIIEKKVNELICCDNNTNFIKIKKELDKILYEVYNLKESDIKIIESEFNDSEIS